MLVCLVAVAWWVSGVAGRTTEAWKEAVAIAGAGGIWLTGHILARSGERLVLVWRALTTTLFVFCLVALLIHMTRYTGDPLEVSRIDTMRLRATFGSPNTAATLFAMTMVLSVGRLIYILNHPTRLIESRAELIDHVLRKGMWSIATFGLAFACLVLTVSRAGLVLGVGLSVLLVVFEYVDYRRRRGEATGFSRRVRLIMFGAIGLFFVLAASGEILGLRAQTLTGDASGRLNLFSIYWEAWQAKPVFGHGLGSFDIVNDRLATLENAHMTVLLGAAHNVGLQWLIQGGLVGFGFVALVFLACHVPITQAVLARGARSRTFLRTVIAVSLLVLLHGMVDYGLEIPSVMWTYSFVLGLGHGRAFALGRVPVETREMEASAEIAGA